MVFATALGGVFALVYAWAHGRLSDLSPLATAGAIAVLGYVSVTLVPGLKYAANPPAVGSPETIGMRTGLYFLMLAISIAGMVAAVVVARRVTDHRLGWLAGGATYAGIVVLAALILPAVREVPADFPAEVLQQFRTVSLLLNAILWGGTGLIFGWLVGRGTPSSMLS
ncbi:CbtA family protein, partial [Paracoccus salipaludis]|uniref:CbtA family protein n=1 Tax=Paracoccus salipaludis TaxID=2032623 RepID=UPI001F0A9FDB